VSGIWRVGRQSGSEWDFESRQAGRQWDFESRQAVRQ